MVENIRSKRASSVGVTALAISLAFLVTVPSVDVQAATLTKQQLIEALKGRGKQRSFRKMSPKRQSQWKRFLDRIRKRGTRRMSAEDRVTLANIANSRPSVDLEIYFAFDSANIRPEAIPALTNLGKALASVELRGAIFLVAGHTDAKGSTDYNQKLSERRANAVRRFLIDNFKVDLETVVAVGYGEEQLKIPQVPLADKNRRVQVVNLGGSVEWC